MPRRCYPNWIEAHVRYSRYQEAPTSYHIWTALATLASAVNRKIWIDRGYFKIFPNLYVAIVGPTGITKSTATDIGMSILEEATKGQFELIRGQASSWYLYDWFSKLTSSGKPCLCTIYADEMRELFSDFNKTELVTLLTSLFTCPASRDFNLKNQGKLHMENVCINILICTTPEWLITGTSVNDIDGGFVGRFVHVYEDKPERNIPFPEDFSSTEQDILRKDLVEDLKHIATLSGKMIITDQAKAEYIIWYHDRGLECKDERLRGYYARKRDLIFKVAMLISISRGDSLVIDEVIMRSAFKFLERIEAKMGNAFSGIVEDPSLKYQDVVFGLIARAGEQGITRAEILRRYANRFDFSVLDRIVKNLLERQVISETHMTGRTNASVVYKMINV